MDEFRIPVVSKEVVIEFSGGVQTAGFVFLPAAAPDHAGAMRLVEWLNGPDKFFPFQIQGAAASVIVNKDNILNMTAYHDRDSGDYDEIDDSHKCGVRLETPHGHYSGNVVIDMPYYRHRVLDALNGDRPFIYLLDGGKEVHVNKKFIVKARELGNEQEGADAV